MTADNDNLSPQERLAKIVAEETGDGRRVVQFFMQVTEGRLDSEGFQPNHRMDAAKELVKIGLTEFEDYIHANASPPKRRAPRSKRPSTDISPEIEEAREELARYARELTQDGRTVVSLYAEIMDGLRDHEGFKPHHRIAAGRELLLRGFGPVSAPWPELEPPQPEYQPEAQPVSASRSLPGPLLDYISDALSAYEEPNPFRELLSPELMDVIESDDPLDECPCAIDEYEGREPYCPDKEGECPYYGLKFPEFDEEEKERLKEWFRRGLRKRAEMMGYKNSPEDDP